MTEIQNSDLTELQRHIDACGKSVDELLKGYRSPEKINTLLDTTMQQIEFACMDMRRLCEKIRPRIPAIRVGHANYHSKTIYGEITLTENNWIHIKQCCYLVDHIGHFLL